MPGVIIHYRKKVHVKSVLILIVKLIVHGVYEETETDLEYKNYVVLITVSCTVIIRLFLIRRRHFLLETADDIEYMS